MITLRRPRSLRTTLTAATTSIALIVVALAGLAIALRLHNEDLRQVDNALQTRVDRISIDAGKVAQTKLNNDANKPGGIGYDAGPLDAGSDTLVRVFASGQLVSQNGDVPSGDLPPPDGIGYSTVSIGGQDWRSLVTPVEGGRVQVLQSLAPVEQRLTDTERIVALVAGGAALLTALAVWFTTGAAMRPLATLRTGAARIRSDRSHGQRLPPVRSPSEIADLTDTLNGMLDELESSMLATRRFTADAGHEIRTPLTSLGVDLETLRRNPGVTAEHRAEILAAMTVEHTRISDVLNGLQLLARGDARALPTRSPIDIVDLTQTAVRRARRDYPDAQIDLDISDEARHSHLDGWPDGLRIALTNLIDNAIRHSRTNCHVAITLTAPGHTLTIIIDDDGPGIPPDQRLTMIQRFTRGNTRTTGTGLGLALVEQQAHLHGGTLHLDTSPQGGLRAQVQLPLRTGKNADGP